MRPATASLAIAFLATALSATPSPAADSLKGGLAAVRASGELAYGVNVREVTRTATGKYLIRFRRGVTGCYYFVSHSVVAGADSSNLASTLSIFPSSTNARELQVFAWHTKTSTYSNEPFMLEVKC